MRKNRVFRSKNFLKTFGSYFCIFLIPICILCTVLLVNLRNTSRKEMQASYDSICQKTFSLFENEFKTVSDTKLRLFELKWIKQLQGDSPEIAYADVLKQKDYVQELRTIAGMDPSLRECAVYFPQDQYIIGSNINLSFSDYTRYLNRVYDITLDQALFERLNSGEKIVKSMGENSVAYLFSMHISLRPLAFGVIILNHEALKQEVQRVMGDAWLLVSNEEEVFFSLQEFSAPPDGYHWERESKYTNYLYQAAFPPKGSLSFSAKAAIAALVAVLLGAGLFLSYILAWKTYKPLYALLSENASSGEDASDEYQIIQALLSRAEQERSSLKAVAEKQLPLLRNEMLRNLLKGYFISHKDIQQQMDHYQIPFDNEMYFCVFILEIGAPLADADKKILTKLLDEFCVSHSAQYLETIESGYIVILGTENGDADVDLVGSRLRQSVSENLAKPVRLFCGELQQGMIGISISFQRAKTVMANSGASVKQSERLAYYFPYDWEIQLAASISKGDSRTVRRILYQLVFENQKKSLLNENADEIIKAVLQRTAQAACEAGIPFEPRPVQEELAGMQGEEKWWGLIDFVGEKTVLLYEKRQETAKRNSLKAYVDEYFYSPDLSLKLLCQEFDMSESMVSKTFKEEAGENFHQYLTRKRMDKAKELLLSHCYDIKTIAAMVGYESRASFTRAFIRLEGVKPTEYEEELQR